jgi:amino-acid N-acetyltransferase
VPAVVDLVTTYTQQRILLGKERVTLYEDIQEFRVAEREVVASGDALDDDPSTPDLVGCGALHVMWEDLAEIRTLAVAQSVRGQGVGHLLLEELLRQAEELGISRVFCLTFEVDFFARHGFHPIDGTPVDPETYAQMLRSADEGIAEFLDLARVKPNTLGNTRMLREL